jgi:uncharacterized SAM-binding protein YcdF (DUF218 family)
VIRNIAVLAAGAAVGAFVVGGWLTYRIWDAGNHDDAGPTDAIVVLGAAQYDGRPSPVFRARLEHAIALYRDGIAPWLVVTGGKAEGDRTTEAATARAFAIAAGVPAQSILVEDRGRTTLESIRAVGRILHDVGLSKAVFVSDRTHMLRVLKLARDQGIAAVGSPTPTSPTDTSLDRRVDATIHELGALALYFVTGQTP